MSNEDIRWKQRFHNFEKAIALLEAAVKLNNERPLNELEKQGIIQRFEFTHELAWNVIKDYFEYQGNNAITGSRDATREAFSNALITDGDGWMEMIKSRNQSSNTYNEEVADEIMNKIIHLYFNLFEDFRIKMKSLYE